MEERTEEEILTEKIIEDLEFWAYRQGNMIKLDHNDIVKITQEFIIPERERIRKNLI